MTSFGMKLRVSSERQQGGRKYMEDEIVVKTERNQDGTIKFAYLAVFDGHGGMQASKFAKDFLYDEITQQEDFWCDNDDNKVLNAIRKGFLSIHDKMWAALDSWPLTSSGFKNTSGTTASIAFIRNNKMYTGHVGDSGIIVGEALPDEEEYKVLQITQDHKPEAPLEKRRIEECGGQVQWKSGIPRVVWYRPSKTINHHLSPSCGYEMIPFLAVARALGDLWSYNETTGKFVVSPNPDVSVIELRPGRHKSIVLASDGIWNMMKPFETIEMIRNVDEDYFNDDNKPIPAEYLVSAAIERWQMRGIRADNLSCIVALIDHPTETWEPPARDWDCDTASVSTLAISDDTIFDLEAGVDSFSFRGGLSVDCESGLKEFNVATKRRKRLTNTQCRRNTRRSQSDDNQSVTTSPGSLKNDSTITSKGEDSSNRECDSSNKDCDSSRYSLALLSKSSDFRASNSCSPDLPPSFCGSVKPHHDYSAPLVALPSSFLNQPAASSSPAQRRRSLPCPGACAKSPTNDGFTALRQRRVVSSEQRPKANQNVRVVTTANQNARVTSRVANQNRSAVKQCSQCGVAGTRRLTRGSLAQLLNNSDAENSVCCEAKKRAASSAKHAESSPPPPQEEGDFPCMWPASMELHDSSEQSLTGMRRLVENVSGSGPYNRFRAGLYDLDRGDSPEHVRPPLSRTPTPQPVAKRLTRRSGDDFRSRSVGRKRKASFEHSNLGIKRLRSRSLGLLCRLRPRTVTR